MGGIASVAGAARLLGLTQPQIVESINLCDFDVILRSGERKSVRVEHHRGHWQNPMSDREIEDKFRSLAADLLPNARVDALIAQVWKLDELPEVETLIQMTRI
jgi:2-methylcitrate dehydratase